MISNTGPRTLTSDVKKHIFKDSVGIAMLVFAAYLVVLVSFLLFGRRDGFTLKFGIILAVGILLLLILISSVKAYKKWLHLAQYGKLIQAQITHIDIPESSSSSCKLTYAYQVDNESFTDTFSFSIRERELFAVGNPLDILYDEQDPKTSYAARHLFPNEYEQAPPDKTERIIMFVLSAFCIFFSIYEYFHITELEVASTDGFIELYWIEVIPYSLFGKEGVTVVFACFAILFFIAGVMAKKNKNQ